MQTLVEGQTLLRDGRYRFLRRIGSGTFAVIMCVLDVQQQRHVAIKCVRQQELNALGEREAATLRRISEKDSTGTCAVVRLLETFEECGHFCLVLELLGPPILDVARWGPWRQAPLGGAHAPKRRLKLFKLKSQRRKASVGTPPFSPVIPDAATMAIEGPETPRKYGQAKTKTDAPVSTPPLSLMEVRQVAVHLCGALAFLHDQGLIHADLKPENVVRAVPEATLGAFHASQSLCSSPVKLVDFGNCLDVSELEAYAQEESSSGFDVQTVTYRAPEVAAGLLLCSAMDMWSLGCLLLECVSGKPLFTLPALKYTVQESSDVIMLENNDLLRQIECVVAHGVPLDETCSPYRSAVRYGRQIVSAAKCGNTTDLSYHHRRQDLSTSLQTLLDDAVPRHHHFHDFIYNLLDVNPATRITAKRALFHPFLQAFFPFATVFAHSNVHRVGERETIIDIAPTISSKKRKARQSRLRQEQYEVQGPKKGPAEASVSARSKDLRQVLKLIPRDVPSHSSLLPR